MLINWNIFQDYPDTAKLLAKENVDREALMLYAREAAEFSTEYQMIGMEFAVNHYGQPDVAMFDFTSMYAAENASRILERRGHRLLMILVGDSLLEVYHLTSLLSCTLIPMIYQSGAFQFILSAVVQYCCTCWMILIIFFVIPSLACYRCIILCIRICIHIWCNLYGIIFIAVLANGIRLCERIFKLLGCLLGNQKLGCKCIAVRSNCRT